MEFWKKMQFGDILSIWMIFLRLTMKKRVLHMKLRSVETSTVTQNPHGIPLGELVLCLSIWQLRLLSERLKWE